MTQEEILEGNKLIAEFIGWQYREENMCSHEFYGSHSHFENEPMWVLNPTDKYKEIPVCYGYQYWPDGNYNDDVKKEDLFEDYTYTLKYHSSWDWLMPIVKKFDYLAEDKVINFSSDYEYWCDEIDDKVTRTYEIEPVFKIMVEAIQWYNQNKQP